MGWVRLAKGTQVEPTELSYKAGDEYQSHIVGKSNNMAVFFAENGRTFSLPAHTLPGARGFGEPLSGKLSIGNNKIDYVLLDKLKANYLFTSDTAYGLISSYENMISRAKAGKAFMTLGNSNAMPPIKLTDAVKYVLFITTDAHILIVKREEIPELARGKGNKLIQIPAKMLANGVRLKEIIPLTGAETLRFKIGRSKENITPDMWCEWIGDRAKRGKKLPKGMEKYKMIEVEL